MRVVADTNTVISALLWHGAPRHVLDAARSGRIALFTSFALLEELQDVLARPKFSVRLHSADVAARDLVLGYAALATIVSPETITSPVSRDRDDNIVLECAVAAGVEYIVSGDNDLRAMKAYRGILIVSANDFAAQLES
ncbi:MAG: putative toxin-antitoxin system toxin component, PIN family [Chloroflexi bacterium]|nr:putative toxin-antitoxin system toxin component, PIN family [Chloroflexota bacterium]